MHVHARTHIRYIATHKHRYIYVCIRTLPKRLQYCVCACRSPVNLLISEILFIKLARIMINCYRTLGVHKFVSVQVNIF
jgi:hypothetical protein